ncbi:transmembrane emp24 domain-containing protein 3-like [Amphiura filiformis]|uniref:transmembrane emp24 domain-containing protein 3-like n=1 Tax=Amphiura filiformis TaxID=82378 RepID=UPI003B22168E
MGLLWICFLACLAFIVGAEELTFELPDNAKQCFYEEVDKGVKVSLEYQVVTGGQYDVDAYLEAPGQRVLYKERKKQYDTYTWTTDMKGVYKFCFSNEFSTFAHKLVYFDFMVGDEDPLLRDLGEHATVLTQLETSTVTIHEALKAVIDYQTHHRLREAKTRMRAEHLNDKVQWWSIGEFVIIFCISMGQVIVLRSFFTDKRPTSGRI